MNVGLALIAAIVVAGWFGGCVGGWLTTRDEGSRPWNWRVLAGPWAYRRWLDRGES